ncbi:hypothetical protein [Pelagirhabdus alkalitolerans]|uniref:hypothetical protein n=1 Tax=Pelagirhabdus alkalitolerans TaxID=1612202 RepID=UPI000B8350B2|nr:hypothetical protein [Pelagirhabdus alkalitolerans]
MTKTKRNKTIIASYGGFVIAVDKRIYNDRKSLYDIGKPYPRHIEGANKYEETIRKIKDI